MKILAGLILAASTAVFIFVNLEMRKCGGGVLALNLPYGMHGDWSAGNFRLWDHEGWGVAVPGSEIETQADPSPIQVAKVIRYSNDGDFSIMVVDTSGKTRVLSFAGSSDEHLRVTEVARAGFDKGNEPRVEAQNWINLEGEDGRCVSMAYEIGFTSSALVALAAAVALIVLARKRSRQPRRRT